MSRWFGFGFSGDVSQHGLVLVPRETLVCVSTHYRVETFIGVYSGDVKIRVVKAKRLFRGKRLKG